ncbi:hypothetical protein SVIOM74S_04739 [Streptomyces violarus]
MATQQYEAGREEAEEQRARAQRAEELLDGQRRHIAALHEDLGRIARAQYRSSGGLPVAAQMILADGPDQLMRGQHAFSQTNLAVNNAISKSRRAEARLAADEAKAAAHWQALEKRNAQLAGLKADIEQKLETARSQLQGQADASVAAGACRGAVRLDQPETAFTSAWVAPVETYELSASYGSGGARWSSRHTGQDFAVPIGTPVRAVGEGRVEKVSCGGPFGIEIVLRHAGGYYTQYAHLAAVAVDQGEHVSPGQWIGQSGSTGTLPDRTCTSRPGSRRRWLVRQPGVMAGGTRGVALTPARAAHSRTTAGHCHSQPLPQPAAAEPQAVAAATATAVP